MFARVLRLAPLATLLAIAPACGAGGDRPTESVATTTDPLVFGASNVSDGLISPSDGETQNAAIAMGNALAVAYNVFYVPTPDTRCPGLSQIGVSYLSGPNPNAPTWRGMVLPVPTGMAALRFDPSVAYVDSGASYTVRVSAVAYSPAVWTGYPSCVSYDAYKLFAGDKLCVMTLDVPKSGAAASLTNSLCFGVPGANYYDTGLSTINGTAYVMAWERNNNTAHFFNAQTGQQLPSPPLTIGSSPIFVKHSPSSVIAPDPSMTFWMSSFTPSNSSWTTPVAMSPSPSGYQFSFSMPSSVIGYREYTAVYVPAVGGPGTTNLFYKSGTSLVGYGRTGTSSLFQTFTSRAGFEAFLPAAEVATVANESPPYPGFHPILTYFDNSGPGGTFVMNRTWPGQPVTALGPAETPCPIGGYWGYNDEMAVRNDSTGAPVFWRFFTDSTKNACNSTGFDEFDHITPTHASSTPQHISGLSAGVFGAVQPAAPSACGRLLAGEGLTTAHPSVQSCDGRFRLQLGSDGNLTFVNTTNGAVLFQSNTAGIAPGALAMQGDGNLVLTSMTGVAAWATNTYGQSGSYLAVQSDGNLVIYTASGAVIWALNAPAPPTGCGVLTVGQGLSQGTSLTSCDGRFTLTMQLDGNLVLAQNGVGTLWSSGSAGSNLSMAVMQSDGNFVIYDRQFNPWRPIWATGTSQPGSVIWVQNDGNLVVYNPNGVPIWASNTCCR